MNNHGRSFVLCPGGAYDRSPCGTGTSAKLACLFADGKLKPKLGPVLFQLPPSWRVNVERLDEFLAALPRTTRYVFEFRNPTWDTGEVYEDLGEDYFTKRPDKLIEVWLFRNEKSFRKGAKKFFNDTPDTPYGYYSPEASALRSTRRLSATSRDRRRAETCSCSRT